MTDWRRLQIAGTTALPLSLVALSVAATAPSYVNHDAAWYLYMVDRWFDGAVLYRDVIDTNPPLIVWLSTVPVAIARWFGGTATALFKAYVFIVAVSSVPPPSTML